jgi:tRNA pseudouridine55 synthase
MENRLPKDRDCCIPYLYGMLTDAYFREGAVLVFNKPYKMSSFGLVRFVRGVITDRGKPRIKVGHAGTLDPLAEGLMVICTGKATRQSAEHSGAEKEYIAEITLGGTTASYDLETEVNEHPGVPIPTQEQISATLETFKGEQWQTPPVFSAKKIDGKRAYKSARKGKEVRLLPNSIEIVELELLSFQAPVLRIRVVCSKGTYIRSLAHDLGQKWGCGAYLSGLIRTRSGNFTLQGAYTMDGFREAVQSTRQTMLNVQDFSSTESTINKN